MRRHKACANEVLNKNNDQEIEIRRIQALLKKEKSKDGYLIDETAKKLVRQKLEVLKASARNLDKIVESPRTEVIMNILQYARESVIATA